MAKLTLTPQQQAVVENRGGSLLVSAAAGSGKTKVLVDRLFRYVTEERCNIDDFLIITYTKAAAAELRSKIASELSKRLGQTPGDQQLRRQLLRVYQADIKTVDAFCTSLLRENTHLLAREGDSRALTPDFRVLDDNEAQLIRQRVLSRTLEDFYDQLDEGRGLLADTLGAGRDDSRLASRSIRCSRPEGSTTIFSGLRSPCAQSSDVSLAARRSNAAASCPNRVASSAAAASATASWSVAPSIQSPSTTSTQTPLRGES